MIGVPHVHWVLHGYLYFSVVSSMGAKTTFFFFLTQKHDRLEGNEADVILLYIYFFFYKQNVSMLYLYVHTMHDMSVYTCKHSVTVLQLLMELKSLSSHVELRLAQLQHLA